MLPAARETFQKIARQLAKSKGFANIEVDKTSFYEDTDYSLLSGVTKITISNDVTFKE